MSLTLSTARDALEIHLSDITNLTWPTATLEECIRSALGELSHAYAKTLTLNGLDAATANTFDAVDSQLIIDGAAAYALANRTAARLEQASSEGLPESLADYAALRMKSFQCELVSVKTRLEIAAEQARLDALQNSADCPHSQWEWDEGTDFS